ncbi:GNAT family N-acetyltransferase [Clostridium perfringens]|uniref:GNAT family N-acetyltransferase n=1 Tax=Clostridium perfringens TaxID=1502 RepID=A0AAW9I6G8_CLOPF|nr:GNAT family N-acetyltransferase [Clostridium perfringens]MBI6080519.1 GNAT family N-acetyltransferase [Clostridium perfringens]MBI6086039.1 GNAT family N-acetyltransferase [Clostridium perfringens]MBI6100207.1 GNAT family N-acetyltransferase [Clostridium perfringens]MDV5105548.1 GNAT family N-acetyltransferase [Clostridium perfringens]MDZ5000038.1 GNAT family N-acetyltransferase [Clostridium perfringens]
MEVKIIEDLKELELISNEWRKMEKQSHITFYDTYDFNYQWIKSYKDDKNKKIFIICVYDKEKIVSIAPLIIQYINKKIFKYRELTFIADADYKNIITDNKSNNFKIYNLIFETIEKNRDKWDILNLNHINTSSKLFKYLKKSAKYSKNFKAFVECPIISLDKFNGYEDYKSKFNSSHAKKYKNKLMREVGYELKVIEDNSAFNNIVDIHIKEQIYLNGKSNNSNRYSIFTESRQLSYIKSIYDKCENVVTFILESKEKEIIGYSTGYKYNGRVHFWNVGVNHKYDRYSVGRILKMELIEWIFENKYTKLIDFGCGGYHWKFEWTDEFIMDYNLSLWSNNKNVPKIKRMFKILEVRRIVKGI